MRLECATESKPQVLPTPPFDEKGGDGVSDDDGVGFDVSNVMIGCYWVPTFDKQSEI